jgi:chromosome segregation ATPase
MWESLISDKPIIVENLEEINKLNDIVKVLDEQNKKYASEIELLQTSRNMLLSKISDMENNKQDLLKQIKKLKESIQIEIRSHEGLKKKSNVWEYEATTIREERNNLKEEVGQLNYKIRDLEMSLNHERSKRLRDLHETDLLRKRNTELEVIASNAELHVQDANRSLLDKLQKMESVMTLNESQKRMINNMSGNTNNNNNNSGYINTYSNI